MNHLVTTQTSTKVTKSWADFYFILRLQVDWIIFLTVKGWSSKTHISILQRNNDLAERPSTCIVIIDDFSSGQERVTALNLRGYQVNVDVVLITQVKYIFYSLLKNDCIFHDNLKMLCCCKSPVCIYIC